MKINRLKILIKVGGDTFFEKLFFVVLSIKAINFLYMKDFHNFQKVETSGN